MTVSDLTALYVQRDAVAVEYAAVALWCRQPVEDQGDVGPQARWLRARRMEEMAGRWLELSAEIRAAQHGSDLYGDRGEVPTFGDLIG